MTWFKVLLTDTTDEYHEAVDHRQRYETRGDAEDAAKWAVRNARTNRRHYRATIHEVDESGPLNYSPLDRSAMSFRAPVAIQNPKAAVDGE